MSSDSKLPRSVSCNLARRRYIPSLKLLKLKVKEFWRRTAEDYDAERAERYGWINRALPADKLGEFVSSLAHRIARFPAAGRAVVKERVNAIGLPPAEDFRRDSDLFIDGVRNREFQDRMQAALKRGFQTRDSEMALARLLGDLADH